MVKKEKRIVGSMKIMANNIDFFGETVEFQIHGQNKYSSICGIMLSLGILVTVLAYGINKYSVMINHDDTIHQKTVSQNEISSSQSFTYADTEFNIALGVKDSVTGQIIEIDDRFIKLIAQTVESFDG